MFISNSAHIVGYFHMDVNICIRESEVKTKFRISLLCLLTVFTRP